MPIWIVYSVLCRPGKNVIRQGSRAVNRAGVLLYQSRGTSIYLNIGAATATISGIRDYIGTGETSGSYRNFVDKMGSRIKLAVAQDPERIIGEGRCTKTVGQRGFMFPG